MRESIITRRHIGGVARPMTENVTQAQRCRTIASKVKRCDSSCRASWPVSTAIRKQNKQPDMTGLCIARLITVSFRREESYYLVANCRRRGDNL